MKFTKRDLTSETAFIIFLVICKILFHLALPEYGYHRDEMYYVSIGDQFSFSNLDMLPLSPLYLKLFTLVFGYSIKVIHLASSALGAVSLLLTCLITKELGGKKYAVLMTGIFMLFSGFIPFGSLYTYDSIDFLVIVAAIYCLVKIFNTENQRLWIYIGVILGFGLMNKLTILFFGLAIFVCLWFVTQRKMFKTRYVWLAGVIALLFLTPYLIWQSRNDWYFLDFASSYAGGISYLASFPEFVWNQVLPNNIAALPVWLTGLSLLLFSRQWKKYRFFGFMYVFLFLLFYKIGAKFYFLIPMYSILLSVGAVKLEELLHNSLKTKIAIPVIFIFLSFPLIPMLVPMLPLNQFISYTKIIGVDAGIKYENLRLNQLPQHFADRFGWEELVRDISEEYHKISIANRKNAGILIGNWGIASAVHFYKDEYDLPEPTSDAGWYYFEAIRKNDFRNVYICLAFSEGTLRQAFNTVIKKQIFTHPYCMPHENNRPIYFCADPKVDIAQLFKVGRRIDPEFLSILRKEGPEKAISFYEEKKFINPKTILFTESQINSIGYAYLGMNKIDSAIVVFKFNVEEFPESGNVYDSLGEAYMVKGNTELAILNYAKSLELNPENENGKKMLEKLRAK